MSTIKVTNIQATGETATRAVSGVAAAWVNFNGTAFGVNDSLNVSSMDDNGTGNYQINYASSFNNTSYNFTGAAMDSGVGTVSVSADEVAGAARTASQSGHFYVVRTQGTFGTQTDANNISVTNHGGLA